MCDAISSWCSLNAGRGAAGLEGVDTLSDILGPLKCRLEGKNHQPGRRESVTTVVYE